MSDGSNENTNGRLFKTRDVADRYDVSMQTAQNWIRKGQLPGAYRVNGRWYVPESALEALEREVTA